MPISGADARRTCYRLLFSRPTTSVDLCDLAAGEDPDPGRHDGVIVAASIHRATHQPEVISWVKRHQPGLSDKPTE